MGNVTSIGFDGINIFQCFLNCLLHKTYSLCNVLKEHVNQRMFK